MPSFSKFFSIWILCCFSNYAFIGSFLYKNFFFIWLLLVQKLLVSYVYLHLVFCYMFSVVFLLFAAKGKIECGILGSKSSSKASLYPLALPSPDGFSVGFTS